MWMTLPVSVDFCEYNLSSRFRVVFASTGHEALIVETLPAGISKVRRIAAASLSGSGLVSSDTGCPTCSDQTDNKLF